ncbi:hypothetical protein CPB84DRAFT_84361 [Gymnopilus junonius]|uniref:Uncharacterized protein n=1 Tax=Gymnopilus junonius TaxID=109634 RepID=A0A9P5P3P7_GYMJU|nr:hypothetical protein CPB84DRAFT_84361 [Gymnopilus junonius]
MLFFEFDVDFFPLFSFLLSIASLSTLRHSFPFHYIPRFSYQHRCAYHIIPYYNQHHDPSVCLPFFYPSSIHQDVFKVLPRSFFSISSIHSLSSLYGSGQILFDLIACHL